MVITPVGTSCLDAAFAKLPKFRIPILAGLSGHGNYFKHRVDKPNR